jgi:hypothetical protein
MHKTVGALAGLLLLSHATFAGAAPTAGEQIMCTRQAAIWQRLFQDGDTAGTSPACRPISNWFGEPRSLGVVETATVEAPTDAPIDVASAPALALLVPRRPVAFASLPDAAASAVDASVREQTPRPVAVEYSHAYEVRRKIHYYASFATIPLFVTQYILGDKLFDDDGGGSTKSAHSAAAVGIEALFGINSVTGVWNLWEARKDPNGRAKRLTHGLLMLGADVGFVATGLLAPEEGDRDGRNTHRNVAIGSMAVSTVSYLIMLIGR